MDAQAGKSPHPLVWVSAIALIVFCSAGVGALMGWIPVSSSKPAEAVAVATPDIQERAAFQVLHDERVECKWARTHCVFMPLLPEPATSVATT